MKHLRTFIAYHKAKSARNASIRALQAKLEAARKAHAPTKHILADISAVTLSALRGG